MILSSSEQAGGERFTIDDLFRRAGVRHSDALALLDPPNCTSVSGAPPRRLTFAQVDAAISAPAAKLLALRLPTDGVVAMQLGNTVDSVIALLGILRARLIAAPLLLAGRRWWRRSRVSAPRQFSPALASARARRPRLRSRRRSNCFRSATAAVSVANCPMALCRSTMYSLPASRHSFSRRPGLVPVARSHSELIAGGLAVFLEGGLARDANILSPIPPGSFANIALGVIPWLLGGGALAPLAGAGLLGQPIKTILALWRAPEQLASAVVWRGDAMRR